MDHDDDDLAPTIFSRLKSNRLDLRDKIDVPPPDIGAISEPLARVKRRENQPAPVSVSGVDKALDLRGREGFLAWGLVLQRLHSKTRIHRYVALPQCRVECCG